MVIGRKIEATEAADESVLPGSLDGRDHRCPRRGFPRGGCSRGGNRSSRGTRRSSLRRLDMLNLAVNGRRLGDGLDLPGNVAAGLVQGIAQSRPGFAVAAAECAFSRTDSAAACGNAARTPRRTLNMTPSRMRARISASPTILGQSLARRTRRVNRLFVRRTLRALRRAHSAYRVPPS